MNNEFIDTITFIKDLLSNDVDVTVVTHGVSNDIDLDENGNYPLAHIQFLNFNNFSTAGVILFDFEIHVLKIRDINNIPSSDKWLRNDNELDNYNTCVNISNRFIGNLKQANDYDIELIGLSTPEAISMQFTNMLDGVKFQIQLGITNQTTIC
jgi:hypothetical protein